MRDTGGYLKHDSDYLTRDYANQKRDNVNEKWVSLNGERQGYDSQRQGYDSQRQGYDSQRQGYDFERQSFDSQSRDYNKKQNLGFQTQLDSQKQNYKTVNYDDWEQREYNNQKLDRSQKEDSDYQNPSDLNAEKTMKLDDNQQHFFSIHRRPQAFLGLGELGTYLKKRVSDIVHGIMGNGPNDDHVVAIYSDEVQSFQDPMEIGDVVSKLALATMNYKNVQICGMGDSKKVMSKVDIKNQQFITYVYLNNIQIKGQYTLSNLLKHSSGDFIIDLTQAVYIKTIYYTIKDRKVYIEKSSAEITYSHANSVYNNIGLLNKLFRGRFTRHLIDSIATKMLEYVGPKLVNQIEPIIMDVNQNFRRAQIVSHLQMGINSTFQTIHDTLASMANANIELTSQGKLHNYEYKHYKAQVPSIILQNIQNFFLLSNKVTYTDSMVHAHVHLGLSHPIILAKISYTDGHYSDKKDIHVQYLVDDIYAKLEFHKELSGGELQLLNVTVQVSNMTLASSQGNYEGDLAAMVAQFPSKLQTYVSLSLQDYIRTQVSEILAQALDRSQSCDTDDSMKRLDGDYQKSVQDYLREGEVKVASKLSQLKDVVYQKLGGMYQMLTGHVYTTSVDQKDMPNLTDPRPLDKMTKHAEHQQNEQPSLYPTQMSAAPPTYDEAVYGPQAGSNYATHQPVNPLYPTQPTTSGTIIALPLGPNPARIRCPSCQCDIRTSIDSEPSCAAHLCCLLLLLIG
ncbi:hypothetical protein V9T40_013872 [Parthenolecanium corni]|uniref:LITAF domain-containing protein n=1 Tax=Parthenolecanium corni TaxID=536013 RepID=A0AAN9TFM1_9HEMI